MPQEYTHPINHIPAITRRTHRTIAPTNHHKLIPSQQYRANKIQAGILHSKFSSILIPRHRKKPPRFLVFLTDSSPIADLHTRIMQKTHRQPLCYLCVSISLLPICSSSPHFPGCHPGSSKKRAFLRNRINTDRNQTEGSPPSFGGIAGTLIQYIILPSGKNCNGVVAR